MSRISIYSYQLLAVFISTFLVNTSTPAQTPAIKQDNVPDKNGTSRQKGRQNLEEISLHDMIGLSHDHEPNISNEINRMLLKAVNDVKGAVIGNGDYSLSTDVQIPINAPLSIRGARFSGQGGLSVPDFSPYKNDPQQVGYERLINLE